MAGRAEGGGRMGAEEGDREEEDNGGPPISAHALLIINLFFTNFINS